MDFYPQHLFLSLICVVLSLISTEWDLPLLDRKLWQLTSCQEHLLHAFSLTDAFKSWKAFYPFNMPRIDFKLWDRVYILKLICTLQMTYSSFAACVYGYLMILQSWLAWENERTDIMKFKFSVLAVSIMEFGLGTLLAFAVNTPGIRGKKQIVLWLVLETILVPISICLLMQLYYRIINSTKPFPTDQHYSRTNIAQLCFILCQYIFMTYAIDFLTQVKKPKLYDPSIRPLMVYAPTDPQITTTESRHIRMSQSFLWQPSSSRGVNLSYTSNETISSNKESLRTEWSSHENMLSVLLGNETQRIKEGDEEKELSLTTQDDEV